MRVIIGLLLWSTLFFTQAIKINLQRDKHLYPLSHFLSQTHSDLSDVNGILGRAAKGFKATKGSVAGGQAAGGDNEGGESMSAKDAGEILGEIDIDGLKKKDPKAIMGTINQGFLLLDAVAKSSGLLKQLPKLAKSLSCLSFAMPVASMILDLALGSQEQVDPAIAALSDKIDALSDKMEGFQNENRAGFSKVSSDICEAAMSSQSARLKTLSGFLQESGNTYSEVALLQLCGSYMGECIAAFLSITVNLPSCVSKIMDASRFEARSNLQFPNYNDPEGVTEGKIQDYVSMTVTAYANILWVLGKYYATLSKTVTTDILVDLKITTDFLKKKMDLMVSQVQDRLNVFTKYQEVDWTLKFDKPGWVLVPPAMAIIGFWRNKDAKLSSLEYAVAGQGFWTSLDDYKDVSIRPSDTGFRNERWRKCDDDPLGGSKIMAAISRGHAPEQKIFAQSSSSSSDAFIDSILKSMKPIAQAGVEKALTKKIEGNWIHDLTLMSCTKPPTSWGSDCEERSAEWPPEKWLTCGSGGWYLAGLSFNTEMKEKGLDQLRGIWCCKPRAPPAGVPLLRPGMRIRLKVPSETLAAKWLRHRNYEVHKDQTDFSEPFAADATFIIEHGLSDDRLSISLRAENLDGESYLRHRGGKLFVESIWKDANTQAFFKKDASFYIRSPFFEVAFSDPPLPGVSFESVNFPGYFIYCASGQQCELKKHSREQIFSQEASWQYQNI